ncbi:hypothetical protein RyT2_11630 [Pseudolactococcus yaeyamensis]
MRFKADYFYKVLPMSLILVMYIVFALFTSDTNNKIEKQQSKIEAVQVKQDELLKRLDDLEKSGQTKDKELENGLRNNYQGLMLLIEDLQRKLN